MSGATVAAILATFGAVLGGGGVFAWLQARRLNSGRITTTPAEILWQQNQQFLAAIQADRDRAVDQRDKLLDGYAAIGPTLASIDLSLRKLLEASATAPTDA
jgi:hypothetical protein